MTFIPVDVTQTQESKPVPNGRYDLSISSAEEGTTKEKKKPQIVVYISIEGHPKAPNVRHNISLPHKDDEPKSKEFKQLLMKRFLTLFNIPFDNNGFNLDDFLGARATAELRLTEPDDNNNQYNEVDLPRLQTEGSNGSRGTAPVARPPKSA